MTKKKQRNVDEARQHRLTDFLRRALSNLVGAGIFCLLLILCSPVLLTPTQKPSKPTRQNQEPASKLFSTNSRTSRRRSTTFKGMAFRRSQMEQQLGMGVNWPDLDKLKQAYLKTNSNDLDRTPTSPSTENSSQPSKQNSAKDSADTIPENSSKHPLITAAKSKPFDVKEGSIRRHEHGNRGFFESRTASSQRLSEIHFSEKTITKEAF